MQILLSRRASVRWVPEMVRTSRLVWSIRIFASERCLSNPRTFEWPIDTKRQPYNLTERSSSKREFLTNVWHKVTGGLGGDDSRNESIMLKDLTISYHKTISRQTIPSQSESSDPWQCTLSETTYCNYYRARPSGWSAPPLYTHHKQTCKQVFFFCSTMITGPGLGLFLYLQIVPVFFRASVTFVRKYLFPRAPKTRWRICSINTTPTFWECWRPLRIPAHCKHIFRLGGKTLPFKGWPKELPLFSRQRHANET